MQSLIKAVKEIPCENKNYCADAKCYLSKCAKLCTAKCDVWMGRPNMYFPFNKPMMYFINLAGKEISK